MAVQAGILSTDRTAILMLSKAVEDGELDRNSTVVESSSGNMAIALALVCRYLDLTLVVVTDPKVNQRTLDILNAYGARIERVTEADSSGNYLDLCSEDWHRFLSCLSKRRGSPDQSTADGSCCHASRHPGRLLSETHCRCRGDRVQVHHGPADTRPQAACELPDRYTTLQTYR